MLQLPSDGFKPPVTVTGSTYMFNVMKGLIQVTLNENMFVVTKGCKVQIPEGNEYSLRNIGQGDAYLFCSNQKTRRNRYQLVNGCIWIILQIALNI